MLYVRLKYCLQKTSKMYQLKCAVPENIHTPPQREFHLGFPHLPGFSIFVRNWWPTPPPLPLQNFHSIRQRPPPPIPLEKFIFTKKDYQSKERRRLWVCNGFHLISLRGLELEHNKLPTKQPLFTLICKLMIFFFQMAGSRLHGHNVDTSNFQPQN